MANRTGADVLADAMAEAWYPSLTVPVACTSSCGSAVTARATCSAAGPTLRGTTRGCIAHQSKCTSQPDSHERPYLVIVFTGVFECICTHKITSRACRRQACISPAAVCRRRCPGHPELARVEEQLHAAQFSLE
jgi:hypothetical protein